MGYRALQEATQTRLPRFENWVDLQDKSRRPLIDGVRARSRPGWCGRPTAKGG